MNEQAKYTTREEWLQAAVKIMTPIFEGHGYKVPAVHVSTGWPSSKGLGKARKVLGECWDKKASDDGVAQIFISPLLTVCDDPVYHVLHVLVHEMVHAVVGHAQGHNKVFGKCARAMGLEGKLTSTHASPDLMVRFGEWVKELGSYPHSKLNPLLSGKKKQTTRMIKCSCSDDGCDFIVRASRKALEEVGSPLCPHNKQPMKFELPDDEDGDEGGEE
jgi:hypothetical protein